MTSFVDDILFMETSTGERTDRYNICRICDNADTSTSTNVISCLTDGSSINHLTSFKFKTCPIGK